MPTAQMNDDDRLQENTAAREARELTELIARINALIENQVKFETKQAK